MLYVQEFAAVIYTSNRQSKSAAPAGLSSLMRLMQSSIMRSASSSSRESWVCFGCGNN